jgi:hypothetical protein
VTIHEPGGSNTGTIRLTAKAFGLCHFCTSLLIWGQGFSGTDRSKSKQFKIKTVQNQNSSKSKQFKIKTVQNQNSSKSKQFKIKKRTHNTGQSKTTVQNNRPKQPSKTTVQQHRPAARASTRQIRT